MRTRRRERGSTILYAIILSGIAATLAVANLQLSSSARLMQDRREDELRWKYAKSAAAALFDTTIRSSPATTPSTITMLLGGEQYSISAAATSEPKEYRLTITNEFYGTDYATAIDPRGKHPFLYGLFVDNNCDINNDLTLGSASELTHAYFERAVSISTSQTHRVYGAVDYKPSTAPAFDEMYVCATGTNRPNLTPVTTLNYTVLANLTYLLGATINGGTYNSGSSAAYVVNVVGAATISGTYTGRVTIYASGKVTIQAPLKAATASSKMVIIGNGDVEVKGSGGVDAFVYTDHRFDITTASAINWRGAIACQDYKQAPSLALTLDPLFYDRDELVNFRVPRDTYGLD